MKTVYIIGGMGSGKSTVSRMLSSWGVPVVNLDDLGHDALAAEGVQTGLSQAFGADVINCDGRVNRALLATRAFATQQNTQLLSSIVQPIVLNMLDALLSDYASQNADAVAIECSAFRSRDGEMLNMNDAVLAVCAPKEERIKRAEKIGWQTSDVEHRIAQQITDDERRAIADFVIENDGSVEELQQKVLRWWAEFMK